MIAPSSAARRISSGVYICHNTSLMTKMEHRRRHGQQTQHAPPAADTNVQRAPLCLEPGDQLMDGVPGGIGVGFIMNIAQELGAGANGKRGDNATAVPRTGHRQIQPQLFVMQF